MRIKIALMIFLVAPHMAFASDYLILKCDYAEVKGWSDNVPDDLDKTRHYKIQTSGPGRGSRFVYNEDEGGWEKEFGRMQIKEGAFEYSSDVSASRVYINRRSGDYRVASDLGSVFYYRGSCSAMEGEPKLQRPKF
ncbi:hypothetical protein [Alcanivorax sediminis]|uniref:Uncharacterized protein n=1 Tax=Alcanivorax sediminis TaxID=2663008 RepID=A0A6N7LT70_9GAMM|nr:hypothetical protein [Alcanivorax sediminis]MQX52215.1 hypothetical protein [Alcanivorax sediminis]